MKVQKTKFKFPRVDTFGDPILQNGMLGSAGFTEKFTGETAEDDSVVATLRLALSNKPLADEDALLLRSFASAWLIKRQRNLGNAVSYAVELRESIGFLSQVGFLDRTALTTRNVAAGIAGIALTWELLQFCDEPSFGGLIASELAIAVLPDTF